jgi:hypothetical protein
MSTKDKLRIYFWGLLMLMAVACGQRKENLVSRPVPAVSFNEPVVVSTEPKKIVLPQYYYQGERYRDPFVPLIGPGRSLYQPGEIIPPNLGTLMLKGIMTDRQGVNIAILSSGGVSYFLKNGRLYDSQYRLIPGITGVVKKDRVLVITSDRIVKELTIQK